jgi:hypothetical protein
MAARLPAWGRAKASVRSKGRAAVRAGALFIVQMLFGATLAHSRRESAHRFMKIGPT